MLHRLELTLGQQVFETTDQPAMVSAVALTVDSQLFERACDRGEFEEACQLYRGDFLAGFSPEDCPEFDAWAFFRREALRGRLMHALERLVQEKDAAGDYFAATTHAARLVELTLERGVRPASDPQPAAGGRSKCGSAAPRGTDAAAA